MDAFNSPVNPGPEIEPTAEGLRVSMRAPRSGCLITFLGVWLAGWTFGGIEAMRAVSSTDSLLNVASLFLLFWLAGWIVGELAVAAFLAFLINGAEIITANAEAISQRAEAFGYGYTRRWALEHVTNLRPVASEGGTPRDLIAFDFAGSTVRFGSGLNETDARRVAEAIWEHLPQLRPPA
jgi:hypothetical protein